MKGVGGMALSAFALGGTGFAAGRDTDTTLLARYVLTPPALVRDLRITGSDFQETYVTLHFSTTASVRFPVGESLRAETALQARTFAHRSPCAADLKAQSSVRLWRVPKASTNVGRLVVRTGQRYCILVWNTDS
jgi:hypothetical protein